VQTWHIEVKQKFDWSKHDKLTYEPNVTKLSKDFKVEQKQESLNEPATNEQKELKL
jgi:hypothetical protein